MLAQLQRVQNKKILVPGIYVFLFFLALVLRTYNVDEPNKPVFDEIFFAKYAYQYETGEQFYHTHPPLVRYTFYLGMKAYHSLPWVDASEFGNVAFDKVSPLSYRWVNVIVGLGLCLAVVLLCWQLSRSHVFTMLALFFVATDGALVVASRFGLSNAHITFWGFFALYFLSRSLSKRLLGRDLVYASLCLGCVISVKWNGLSYWTTVVAFMLGVAITKWVGIKFNANFAEVIRPIHALQGMNAKKIAMVIGLLVVVPFLVYRIVWVPDRMHNEKRNFTEVHQQIWGYHSSEETVGSHPYCSKWYEWPLMKRPIGYDFEKLTLENDCGLPVKYYKDIHSFGNPLLYWIAALAVAITFAWVLVECVRVLIGRTVSGDFYVRAFLVTGFFAAWLPWAFVSRCTFLYHYQSASVFSFLTLAWCLTRLAKECTRYRIGIVASVSIVLIIAGSFIYFLPFNLGIPVTQTKFYEMMWFQSWI